MSKELLLVVETVSNEKAVSKDIIFDALETAIAAATRRQSGQEMDVVVSINEDTGNYETFRSHQVVEDDAVFDEDIEIGLTEAKKIDTSAELGKNILEKIDNIPFGRVGAQLAKQVIIQKVREAERQKVYDEYLDQEGKIIYGTVKRQERGNVIVDLGNNVEGIIFKEKCIPRETLKQNDRIRAYIESVNRDNRGHQIILSRTATEFLVEMFKLEVPEIASGIIEIKGAARDPGFRSKIAVHTFDPRIDPAGACIGIRGSRVQNITNEMAGERVDIIIWKEDIAEFAMNAIAPAEPTAITAIEEDKQLDLAFTEEKLAIAVGRGGQNVRLASELVGWELNLMTDTEFEKKAGKEAEEIKENFIKNLGVDEELALILIGEGFSSLDEIAYVDKDEFSDIEDIDDDVIEMLQERARDYLLTQAIVNEEKIEGDDVNLIDTLPGINDDLLLQLRLNEIYTWDDLAELSTDELVDLTGLSDESASELIMNARAPWFA